MGGAGSGRQKAQGPRDATIRVVTSLEMWEDTVHGFNEMENAASAYTGALDDGTPVLHNYAEGNFVMAKEVKKAKKSTEEMSEEMAKNIIILQGSASALNQMSGGIRKTTGGLKLLGWGTDETHRKMDRFTARLELATGPLETMLSITTLVSTAKAYNAMVVNAETAAVTANTAAVTANNVAWYANPMYGAIALIVGSILLLVGVLIQVEKQFKTFSNMLDGAGERLDGLNLKIKSMSFGGILEQITSVTNGLEGFLKMGRLS